MAQGCSGLLAISANAVQVKAVIRDFETEITSDSLLPLLYDFIKELFYPSALVADQMIMVVNGLQLENRMSAFKVMAHDQISSLELRQYPIHSRQPHFLPGLDQSLVNVLGTHMACFGVFQQLQDLDPGQGDFQTCLTQLLIF